MTYTQDSIPRDCAICERTIEPEESMLDLFREESSLPNSQVKLLWAHERCVKSAIETFLKKKWTRTKV